MKPLATNILITPIAKTEKATASGIVYELNTRENHEPVLRGKVADVGNKVNSNMKRDIQIEVGDTVTYFSDAAVRLQHNGEPIHIVSLAGIETISK
jgi:co-chaperonin GroES (HSP10)